MQAPGAPGSDRPRKPWLRSLGAAGFAFFLIKGLLWIFVPIFAARSLLGPAGDRPATPAETRVLSD